MCSNSSGLTVIADVHASAVSSRATAGQGKSNVDVDVIVVVALRRNLYPLLYPNNILCLKHEYEIAPTIRKDIFAILLPKRVAGLSTFYIFLQYEDLFISVCNVENVEIQLK